MKSTGVTALVISLFYSKTKMSRNHGNADCTDMGEGHAFSDGWNPLKHGLEQTWLVICSSVTGNKSRGEKGCAVVLGSRTAYQLLKS